MERIEQAHGLINIQLTFFPSLYLVDWCSPPLWSRVGLKGLFEAGFANRHIRLVFPSISLTLLFVTVF